MEASAYDTVYAMVRRIPPGQVSSYGRIAELLGRPPGHARLVGYALHALRSDAPGSVFEEVPWWRVVNAAGRISNPYEATLQRHLLEAEGIAFDAQGRIDLTRFLWQPDYA